MLRTFKPFPLAVAVGLALASPDAASNDALRLYQQERQREEADHRAQRFRQLQRNRRGAAPTSPATATTAPGTGALSTCRDISGLRIGGNQQIPQADIIQALSNLPSGCMDDHQVNRLLKAITDLYLREGYIGARPYLVSPLEDGASLDILIVEGFVESIELGDPELPLSLASAFPDMLGRPLLLRDLEQGLDQLNRLRAFDLTADIEPGQFGGGSRIVIRPNSRPPRWGLGATLDNRGGLQTGRNRSGISLSLDSPLQLNDYLRVTASHTLAQGPAFSRSVGLQYSIPYGPWTFSLSTNRLEYANPLPGTSFQVTGTSTYHGLSLERSLWRDQRTLLSASTSLNRKSLDSFFFNYRIPLQSPTLLVAQTGLNLIWINDGIWSAYLGYAQGLNGAGADTRLAQPDAPDPQFRKYLGNLGYTRQGLLLAIPWRWNSELNLQYSQDRLPPIEQLLLTDDSAVRGWRQSSLASSSAAVLRNTLSLTVRLDQQLQVTPHLGVDLAWAKATTQTPERQLSGAHAGVDLGWVGGQLELDYQKSLNETSKQPVSHEPGYWLISLSLNI
ncbi:ShlB/FhaC/HecB family hemolysin secretion/activation protein [Pseudomonas akapageensis]|uniref:ShlB/FhaC/HecB family hemolysin secretion/activation protein n=1 Tax=Pseudomonas akapageensis TaxID=2609961 RepID=UPI00140D1FEB|nr:ShlB/FhaC/HecB family hemolysin secretion/activation protein [Pseudomonas akapageensis]